MRTSSCVGEQRWTLSDRQAHGYAGDRESAGAGQFTLCMWCTFGAVLAALIRGTAVPIGPGRVRVLVAENVAGADSPGPSLLVGDLEKRPPGVNAGSWVAALGGDGVAAALVGGGEAAAPLGLHLTPSPRAIGCCALAPSGGRAGHGMWEHTWAPAGTTRGSGRRAVASRGERIVC